jgi:hypothetical protein
MVTPTEASSDSAPDPSRRSFIKTAAFGAFAALILKQQAIAREQVNSLGTNRMITLLGIVDVAQALADGDLSRNIYWTDNNRLRGSLHEGSNHLVTRANQGDILNWIVSPLQVENYASIHSIQGTIQSVATPALDPTSPFGSWRAVVSTANRGPYPYNVTLNVHGVFMSMTTDLSLEVIPAEGATRQFR